MSFGRFGVQRLLAQHTPERIRFLGLSVLVLVGSMGCGSSTPPAVVNPNIPQSIAINGGAFQIERGWHTPLTTTVVSTSGAIITVPIAWRSLNENVVTIDANGVVTAVDTGTTFIFASSLNVTSQGIGVRVAWQGPASIATSSFTPPAAVSPGATPDSIRVLVSDRNGKPVPFASLVKFVVTSGGGSVSPIFATTNQLGIAAARWTLGSVLGVNTVSATVVGQDSVPYSFVKPNTATFSIRTIAALVAVAGDGQTGQILAALPVNPSVKVIDTTGKPRPGVPVTFVPTGGGRVATTTVSTGADGIASPGVWTLGDTPGAETLVVTAEKATLTLTATGTGSPIHLMPKAIALAGGATCAIISSGTASCWGGQPNVGDSGKVNRSSPTPTRSAVTFVSLTGSPSTTSHFCGVSDTKDIYCWGLNALVDTSGKVATELVPTRLPGTTGWTTVAPGFQHNCALATDQTAQCWGDDQFGQLGDRLTAIRFVPAPVYGGFQFTSIVSGSFHSCALVVDGSAFCWGLNNTGQIGDGTTVNRLSPTAVAGGITFQSIGAGTSWTCGLATTGKVYCWGNLLVAGSTSVTTPRVYATTQNFTVLAVGGVHACALTADGSAYCWGLNNVGQLGDSTQVDRQNPVPVVTSLKFKGITAGFNHTCASISDGSIACWGDNSVGELADSTAVLRTTPRFIVTGVNP